MRRREPPVPLTIQALGDKLDQLTAGQAGYEDLLRRVADGQQRHAEVLDVHTSKLNELISGQNAHTELVRQLVHGQERQTELLEQLLRSRDGTRHPHPPSNPLMGALPAGTGSDTSAARHPRKPGGHATELCEHLDQPVALSA